MTGREHRGAGVYLGYDPGGNDAHGVAALQFDDAGNLARSPEVETVETAEDAVQWLARHLPSDARILAAIGIDTLTVWSTGSAGWRPADDWLRAKYPRVQKSVAAPNSLRGAMVVSGMAAIIRLREQVPEVIVSEAHPKVLYFALAREPHAFSADAGSKMLAAVCGWIGVEHVAIDTDRDHEWDALVSAYAVRQGVIGAWATDLHTLPTRAGETLVRPAGPSHFFWPDS